MTDFFLERVRLSVSIKRGMGILIVHSQLPPELELVSGNNLRVLWKGIRAIEEERVGEDIQFYFDAFPVRVEVK